MNKITSKKTLSCLTVLVGITLMGTAVNAIEGDCKDQKDLNACQQLSNCTWVEAECVGMPGETCTPACNTGHCHMQPLAHPYCAKADE